jgi:hypothetical protein
MFRMDCGEYVVLAWVIRRGDSIVDGRIRCGGTLPTMAIDIAIFDDNSDQIQLRGDIRV